MKESEREEGYTEAMANEELKEKRTKDDILHIF